MEEIYIKASDVKSIATIPSQRPTFLHTEDGPIRILGFLVCLGKRFEPFNCDAFATFPIDEGGIVHTQYDGNNGLPGLFHGPIKKDDYDYIEAFQTMFNEKSVECEHAFIEYCKEIGLEIID